MVIQQKRQARNIGVGVPNYGRGERTDIRRIMTPLPEATFNEIRQLALASGTSFAEQIRRVVALGLAAKNKDATS